MAKFFKVFLIFFLLGVAVYANSLNNKFQIDDDFILTNPLFSQTKYIFSSWNPYNNKYFAGCYRPIAQMGLAFCFDTFKNNYWQYHLLGLFLFVIVAALIYLLIYQLTGNYYLAFLTGEFFLIHPINGIMVNYIVTSSLSLELIFMITAILLLWGSLERKKDRKLYNLSLLVAFLSLFIYDMGVMLPVYLGVVVLIFRKEALKEKILYLLPYFLINFLYMIFRSHYLRGTPLSINIALFHMSMGEYLSTLYRLVMWYILKLIFLRGIVMQWAMPVVHDHLFWNILGAFLLLFLFVFSFIRSANEKVIQLALAWILIGFAPTCLVAFGNPGVGPFVEPHWFVFVSIGFFIITAHCFLKVLMRTKMIGIISLTIMLFSWGCMSHAYNQLWRDQKTYDFYWLSQNPNFKSINYYLAYQYEIEGDLKNSKKLYIKAISGNPLDKVIYDNLCYINQLEGLYKTAELDCQKALKVDPNYALAYGNLGYVYYAQGDVDKAKESFDRSLILDPFDLDARRGLAYVALKHADYKLAIMLCRKNLDIVSDDAKTLLLLGEIYKSRK